MAGIYHRITQYKRSETSCLTCCIAREAGCCALSGGLLMEASPTCFCALLTGIETGLADTRCHVIWCTPQQLLWQLLYQCPNSTETIGPKPVCLVPKQPVSGPDSESTEPSYTVLLDGADGPFHDPARRGSEQCAKPALARFVTLLTAAVPHGETTVPSKLGPWSHLNPVLTGKTGTRGTTSRRRYRLNDPWSHQGWYRLFSPSLRHFAHLTLPNGRWRWIR